MAFLLFLLSYVACLQLAHFYPAGDEDPILKNYGMQFDMMKRHFAVPLRESLLRTLVLRKASRDGQSAQRKKIDTTFIRFGRSHNLDKDYEDNRRINKDYKYLEPSENQGRLSRTTHIPPSSGTSEMSRMKAVDESQNDSMRKPQFRIRKSSSWTECKFNEPDDVIRFLMGKPCIRSYQKVKRENVNDTFIRFGKREPMRWKHPKSDKEPEWTSHYYR